MLQMPDVHNKIQFEVSDLGTALTLFYEGCRERGNSIEKHKEHYKITHLQIYDKSNQNVILTPTLELKDTPFPESEYRCVPVVMLSTAARPKTPTVASPHSVRVCKGAKQPTIHACD